MAKTDVINLAKSGKATAKKPAAKKAATKKPAARKRKPVVKEPTAEEIRDKKAKETVDKLLADSPIVTLDKKEEDLLILDETPEEPKGVEWLEEQVGLLSQKNEALAAELNVVTIENEQLRGGVAPPAPSDGQLKGDVIRLFDELQTQLINRGIDPQTGAPKFVIHTVPFMNRLIKFFPFLEQMKRYK